MNKTDEKRLHKDPRYKANLAAYDVLREKLHAADTAALAAIGECFGTLGEPGEFPKTYVDQYPAPTDEALFRKFRPKGDRVRVTQRSGTFEIANVTSKSVFLGTEEYRLSDGARCERWSYGLCIHPDDLAKIKSGELKGWRQKKWGE